MMKRGLNYPALAVSGLIVLVCLVLASREIPAIPLVRGIFGYGSGPGLLHAPPPPSACPGSKRSGDPFRFTGDCKGEAASPDGAFLIVKNGAAGDGVGLVRGADGVSLDDFSLFDDGKGFAVGWSPQSKWFFVDHPGPSGVVQFRIYRMDGNHATRWDPLPAAAQKAGLAKTGCKDDSKTSVDGRRWAADGKRVALLVRPDAKCAGATAQWMIGEVDSGEIDPASIRPASGDAMPHDGPYATF